MKAPLLCLALAALLPCLSAAQDIQTDGSAILVQSDKKLLPDKCSYEMKMATTDSDGKTKVNVFEGWKSSQDKNVMIVRQPARYAGSVHLRKGGVISTYYSTNKKVTQMGYQAVFMDSVLNYGDVMASELSIDYDVVGLEKSDSEYVLTLKVKSGHEGYDKILLTIDKTSLLPKKKVFYSLSGMVVKTCDFTDIELKEGKLVSMREEFFDSTKSEKTLLDFTRVATLDSVPDKYYNEAYISRLGY